jgi:hypothetical protein
MGVSGQRHAPAALYPRGKDPRYPLYRRLGGPQSRSGHWGYRKNPLPPPGIEPRSPGRPARSQTLYCLSYPAPHSISAVYKWEEIWDPKHCSHKNVNILQKKWTTTTIAISMGKHIHFKHSSHHHHQTLSRMICLISQIGLYDYYLLATIY